MVGRLALLAVLFGVSCTFSPDFGEGRVACGSDGHCPPDYHCTAGRCYRYGSPGSGGGSTPDGSSGGAPDLSSVSQPPVDLLSSAMPDLRNPAYPADLSGICASQCMNGCNNGCCQQDCSSGGSCQCQNNCACQLQCSSATANCIADCSNNNGVCTVTSVSPSTAVNCGGNPLSMCDVTCQASSGTCFLNCAKAHCILRCGTLPATSCQLSGCKTPVTSCGGGVYVCNGASC
jgi:hypothetical protein